MNKKVRNSNYHFLTAILLILVSCKEGKSEKGEINSTTKDQFLLLTLVMFNQSKISYSYRRKAKRINVCRRNGSRDRNAFRFRRTNSTKILDEKHEDSSGYWLFFVKWNFKKEIHSAKPYDLSGVPSRSKNIQFVLELNLNDFRTQKIKIGDRLNLGDIREAIKARGLNPEKYKL